MTNEKYPSEATINMDAKPLPPPEEMAEALEILGIELNPEEL